MKYRIKEPFQDIHTKKIYKADSVVDFTKERAAEIEKNGGGKLMEPVHKEEAAPEEKREEKEQK